MALCLDGGTRMVRTFDPDMVTDHFARLLSWARRPRSRAEQAREREEGGRRVRLPCPQLWGPPPVATVRVGGERRHVVHFEIPDVVYFIIDLERGTIQAQGKAKALWAYGWGAWAERWGQLVAWWMGEELVGVGDLTLQGWRVTGVELCSDFIGLPLHIEDCMKWVSPGGRPTKENVGLYPRQPEDDDPYDQPARPGSTQTRADGLDLDVETINFGRRSSNTSWCLYRKTRQILAAKGGDASTYSSHWRKGGWNGEDEVTRVELRLCKRGLAFQDEDSGECFDLRDPASLCDRDTLAKVWSSHTHKHRLVLDTGRSRRRREDTDPRWLTVQNACELDEPVMLVQDRAVQTETWKESTARSARSALRALQRVAAMHGLTITDERGYGEVAALLALERLRMEMPEIDEALVQYGDKHARGREEFLGAEMFEHQPERALPGTRKLQPATSFLPAEWLDDTG